MSEPDVKVDTCEADQAVLSLCQEFFQWRLEQSPELASFCGFHQFDEKWDDVSEEAYTSRDKQVQLFIKSAQGLSVSGCSSDVKMSHTLLTQALDLYMVGSNFASHRFPVNYLEEIQGMASLTVSYMKFRSEADFDKYIARLKGLPDRIRQVTEMLKRGVETGAVMFDRSVAGVPDQIDEALATPLNELGILQPFAKKGAGEESDAWCPEESSVNTKPYEATAKDLVMSHVFPALTEQRDYIKNTYLSKARPSAGISTLKNGLAWYQQCLNHHLTCNMTPQEVHEIGLKEVTRIRSEIFKLAAKEGLKVTTLPEIMATVTQRQAGFFKAKEDVLSHVKQLCHERIRPKLAKLFRDIPDMPLSIKPIPEYMKTGPVGYYLNGLPDGSRDGVYFINTHNLAECFPFHLPALSLHEGEPGHHLQMVYALAATHLPDFRRYSEDSKYYLAPRNFPFYTAYVEGWGLYSEALGEEMGIYEDSYELLGRYSFEIFRAARLVVDTGLHAFGWSRDQAIKYMVDNTLESKEEMAREVDRYITWPGQACAYKIGELKIWEVRRKAEKALGDKFDIREFHHLVLANGPVTLQLLEDLVDTFIQGGGKA